MERQSAEPERANRPARTRVAKPAAEAAITSAIEPAPPPAVRGEPARPAEQMPAVAEGDAMPKQSEGNGDDKLLAKTEMPEASAATAQPVEPAPQAPPVASPVVAAPAAAPPTSGETAEAPAVEAPAVDAAAAAAATVPPADAGATAEGDAAPVQAVAAGTKPVTTPASGETNGEKTGTPAAAPRDAGTDPRATTARPAADPATAAPEKPAEPARAEAVRPQVAEVATPTAAAVVDSAVPDPAPPAGASASPAPASPSAFGMEVAQKTAQAPAPGSPVPVHALAVTIAARAGSGATRFDIRLDPAELGRIDVQLTVDRDGAVKSRLVVEKQETLDLLQRDQRNLERALAQAGLQTSEGSLEFSLKDQGGQNARDRQPEPQASRHQMVVEDPEAASALQASAAVYARAAAMRGGVDIRI